MLFGPTMDAIRANGILKNLQNTTFKNKTTQYKFYVYANKFKELGLKVHYPWI